MRRNFCWSALEWTGLEHLAVCERPEGVFFNGLVLAAFRGKAVRVSYQIRCDVDRAVRSLHVQDLQANGQGIRLLGDGRGHWRCEEGDNQPELDGCIDVDLAISPSTNTLPIRRLGLAIGESRSIAVVYVTFPALEMRAVRQRYTRAANTGYRYESGTFSSDLAVDDSGFVLDYPGIWERCRPTGP